MIVGLIVGVVVGAVAGALAGVLVQSRRLATVTAEARTAEARLADAQAVGSQAAAAAQAAEERARAGEAGVRDAQVIAAQLREQLEQERRRAAELAEVTEETRRQLLAQFAELSQQALQTNNEQFLTLAEEKLQKVRVAAGGDLAQRQQAIEQLVRPLREQLDRYGKEVQEMERHRSDAFGGLAKHLENLEKGNKDLERETRNLASALRSPAARGRWGELQLRKVVEMAGMLEHCDFDVQVSTGVAGERLRPDMVVHLPGAKHVVVDSKVPLEAFQSAVDAETEEERRALLQNHARQVRAHIDALAKKEYWRQVEPSPEFVVAFIPGDPLLTAASEHDPSLIEHAVDNHVLPATPTTLISLLWAVAYGWRQDALADNAREVQRLGTDLYQRLATLGDHLAKLGRSLGSSVDAYNKAVGSLESRVLATARRFPALGVGSADKGIAEVEQVVLTPRDLQAPELAAGEAARGDGEVPVVRPAGQAAGAVPAGGVVGDGPAVLGAVPGSAGEGEGAGGQRRELPDGVTEIRQGL